LKLDSLKQDEENRPKTYVEYAGMLCCQFHSSS